MTDSPHSCVGSRHRRAWRAGAAHGTARQPEGWFLVPHLFNRLLGATASHYGIPIGPYRAERGARRHGIRGMKVASLVGDLPEGCVVRSPGPRTDS